MRGGYITLSVGPRPLMGAINGCRKTAEEPWWAVNVHHSGIERYNPQGFGLFDLGYISLGFALFGPSLSVWGSELHHIVGHRPSPKHKLSCNKSEVLVQALINL
jgi:hypothetical protein